jgi:hypothetical protein
MDRRGNSTLAVALAERVATALRDVGIDPDGPVVLEAAVVPHDLERRAHDSLLDLWSAVASVRLRWHDETASLGRDARLGGLWLMTPDEVRDEIDEYAGILEDERHAGSAHYGLAVLSWGAWTPFHRFASGDCLALDESGAVVVWQHDLLDAGPYYHGLLLGSDLNAFLEEWARVAWAEPRDWRTVAGHATPGIDLARADWRVLLDPAGTGEA